MSPVARVRPRRLPTVVAAGLVLVGLLTGAAAGIARSRDASQDRARYLEQQQASMQRRFEQWIEDSVVVLDGVRGLFALGDPGAAGFGRYVEQGLRDNPRAPDLQATYHGLQPIGFVRRVPSDRLDDLQAERRRQARSGFERTYEDVPEHYIVDYLLPDLDVVGADLAVEPTRRVPLEQARDEGIATASGWFVPLTQAGLPVAQQSRIAGVYLPVYAGGRVPTDPAERRRQLQGWVISSLRQDELGSRVMPIDARVAGRLELFDAHSTSLEHLAVNARRGEDADLAEESIEWQVDALGQTWTLRYTPTRAELEAADSGVPPWLPFAAILAAGMLPAGVIVQLGRGRDRAEVRVAEATDALQRSERSLRSLANTAPVAIFDLDDDERLTFGNAAWTALVGEPNTTARGPVWLPNVHDEDLAALLGDWQNARREGEPLHGRYRLRDPRGQVRWVQLSVVPILDDDGRLARAIGCLVDVSRVVEFERELSAARDQALVASQLKSDFLANVSHEVRTPLNGVLGMAELLMTDDLEPAQRERVRALRSAGAYLLDLVDQVLDFSTLEAGRIKIEEVDFDLHELLGALGTMTASTVGERGLRFEMVLDPALPRRVVGDPMRLRQVLGNLLGNATKFTQQGQVRLVASSSARERAAATLRFEVTDTGIGIPASSLARIFDPFTQADTSTTRRFGGTGLGLAISSELVSLMGGDIGVDSEPGCGSTFWFTLPVRVPADQPVGSLDGAFASVTAGVQRPSQLPEVAVAHADDTGVSGDARTARRRVLLVEDNAVNQMVARGLLESLGCDVGVAVDGVEALDLLARDPAFDAVLMDCQMPRLDGYATTARIRQMQAGRRRIPIIAMTASASADDRRRCLDAGMDAFISKPVRRDALADVLGRVVTT